MRKIKAHLINFIYFFLLVLVAVVAVIAWQWRNFQSEPLPIATNTIFILKPGTKIDVLADQLMRQGIIDKPNFFILWAIIHKQDKKLKVGEYAVNVGMTAPQLLKKIVEGKVILWRVTFPEGRTFRDILAIMQQNPHLAHMLNQLDNAAIMQKLGYTEKNPEGLFFPDTYLFSQGTTDITILHKAYERMQQKLATVWEKRQPDLPYENSYQALIVASVIEREAKLASERPQIAGVIMRRLQKDMLLQMDPTVIYGLGKPYSTLLTKADLRTKTAYNTYINKGLPPTPICMPGFASLWAALNPDKSDSLYFVSNADGSHHFSATLAQHNKAVVNYREKIVVKQRTTQSCDLLTSGLIPFSICQNKIKDKQ